MKPVLLLFLLACSAVLGCIALPPPLPPANDRSPLADRILKDDPGVAVSSEEEHGTWVGPLLTTILTTMLLLGVLVLFVMPRFRDPLGG